MILVLLLIVRGLVVLLFGVRFVPLVLGVAIGIAFWFISLAVVRLLLRGILVSLGSVSVAAILRLAVRLVALLTVPFVRFSFLISVSGVVAFVTLVVVRVTVGRLIAVGVLLSRWRLIRALAVFLLLLPAPSRGATIRIR